MRLFTKQIFKNLILTFLLFFSIEAYSEKPVNHDDLNQNCFIQNKGQWPNEVMYLSKQNGVNVWITRSGVTYDFYKNQNSQDKSVRAISKLEKGNNSKISGHVVHVENKNALAVPLHKGKHKSISAFNYFKGKDPSNWASGVPSYREVTLEGIYNGINQRWYFDKRKLRYDFIVAPHADATQIELKIKGAISEQIKNGELVFRTRFGEVKQAGLYVYQEINNEHVKVSARWKKNKDGFGFELENYDPNHRLVIDPLVWSTFIGGSDYDGGFSIDLDASDNIFIAGETLSTDFPLTVGPYDNSLAQRDAFFAKLDKSASSLLYATFFGGNDFDAAKQIQINAAGEIILAGETISEDFPVTANAFDNSKNDTLTFDLFVAKFNAQGTALNYSSYIGGEGFDDFSSFTIDGAGAMYLVGATSSDNFPFTTSAFDTLAPSGFHYKAFCLKLEPSLSVLKYGTFIGGKFEDVAADIAVDTDGNAYITGHTESPDFPVTSGAFDIDHSDDNDVFVLKLNRTGTDLIFSTYVGSNWDDEGKGIAIDDTLNVYVVGNSESLFFPTTNNAFDTYEKNGGFVLKLDSSGSSLVYSTRLGGDDDADECRNIILDEGKVVVTGKTKASEFPSTPNAFRRQFIGPDNAFLCVVNESGSNLNYSTLIGGSDFGDSPWDLAKDANGDIIIIGSSSSADFPTTSNVYQPISNGGSDIFLSKFCISSTISIPYTAYDIHQACENSKINPILYGGNGFANYNISGLPPGLSDSLSSFGSIYIYGTPTQMGTYDFKITYEGSCGITETLGEIEVNSGSSINLSSGVNSDNQEVCLTNSIEDIVYDVDGATGVTVTGLPQGVNDSYQNKILTISGTPLDTGTFNYEINLTGGCGSVGAENGTIRAAKCDNTGLMEKATQNWIVYPNPSTGFFTISSSGEAQFELIDAVGRTVRRILVPKSGIKNLDASELKGIYFLRGNNSGRTQRIIIQN